MHKPRSIAWALLGTLLACRKPAPEPQPAEPSPPVAQAPSATPAPSADQPPAAQPPTAPPADPPASDPAPVEPAPAPADPAGVDFGVADCDEYVRRVAICDPFADHPNVGKLILDKWRRLKAEGNLADLQKLCSRAVTMYQCTPK